MHMHMNGAIHPVSRRHLELKNSSLKKTFVLAGVLTLIAVVFRFVQQFLLIDHTTGFYNADALGRGSQLVFNLLLAVSAVLIWLSVRRRSAEFTAQRKSFSREFFIGLMVMGFTAELSYLYTFLTEIRGLFSGHGLYLPSALPAIIFVFGGVLLLYQGLLGVSGKQENIDLLSASILSLWGAAALVCTYLSHTIVYHVSDNMLHVLAIASLAFFLTNCLKYMMNVDLAVCGRRAVHYGLFTAYFGFTLVLPRLVTLLIYGGKESLGAPKFYDLVFVLVSAVVALIAAYTIAFGRNIDQPEAGPEPDEPSAAEAVQEIQE